MFINEVVILVCGSEQFIVVKGGLDPCRPQVCRYLMAQKQKSPTHLAADRAPWLTRGYALTFSLAIQPASSMGF